MKVVKKTSTIKIKFFSAVLFWLFGIIELSGQNMKTYANSLPEMSQLFKFYSIEAPKYIKSYNTFEPEKLPIFCKIEHLIEKKSKLGFRFRLGDLNYVNMLENKK